MDKPRLSTLEHENLGEAVYGQISEALMQGRFRAGERITIRDLAASLGTSVTPVRDALLRLIQDGGLILKSQREMRVPILGIDSYRQISAIRIELEGLAARTAATEATAQQLERLESLLAQNEDVIQDGAFERGTQLNQQFHFAVAEIAKMPLLHGILHRLWLQMGPVIAESYAAGGRLMIDNHYRIVDAIRARDSHAAETAIKHDILDAGDKIIERIRSYEKVADL